MFTPWADNTTFLTWFSTADSSHFLQASVSGSALWQSDVTAVFHLCFEQGTDTGRNSMLNVTHYDLYLCMLLYAVRVVAVTTVLGQG